MKTVKNMLAAVVILSLVSCAKNGNKRDPAGVPTNVPGSVEESFASKYPYVQNVKWEKEGEYFDAEFDENGSEKSVLFDAEGKILATETKIGVADLPSVISDYISKNYRGYTIEEAEKIEKAEGTFYETELRSGNQEMELLFDSKGNFIRQEAEGHKDEQENADNDDNGQEGDDQ